METVITPDDLTYLANVIAVQLVELVETYVLISHLLVVEHGHEHVAELLVQVSGLLLEVRYAPNRLLSLRLRGIEASELQLAAELPH